MKPDAELVVLEGRWWDEYNIHLSGVFDLLYEVGRENRHAYYYEHFCDARSLSAIMRRVGRWPRTRLLYIGAHGDPDGIRGSLGEDEGDVTLEDLREALMQVEGSYHGLFLSSCGFLTESNARSLLESDRKGRFPGIRWVAGYEAEEVDFIPSTALELYFLDQLVNRHGDKGYNAQAWVTELENAVRRTNERMAGLVAELGFAVYRRKQGDSGEIDRVL